jgi:FemAB-related protein (PEP-CTERM system-associated)
MLRPTNTDISVLDARDETAWDDFVKRSPNGTFFHLAGWKRVIEKSFGHKTPYLVAKSGGDICGVLPLTHIRSTLFGSRLISNAFCVYGGPVSENSVIDEALCEYALKLGAELGVDGVEFRATPLSDAPATDEQSLYFTFRRTIVADNDANLKAVPRKQRAVIRKGLLNKLEPKIEASVERMYAVYAESVRNLGTPVFSKRYFQELKAEFGDDCEILTVYEGARAVSAVMSFYFRNEVLPYYGGGLAVARDLAANDVMYWDVMRRAALRGCTIFDFGRSKIGTGAFAFKRNWGFEPVPLHYRNIAAGSRDVKGINPLNPKYQLAINVWRQLPLPLTKIIGPMIVRSLG